MLMQIYNALLSTKMSHWRLQMHL